MLNFFKNKINKQAITLAFANFKNSNNLTCSNKRNFFMKQSDYLTYNNHIWNSKMISLDNPNNNCNRIMKLSLKNFTNKNDDNDNDNKDNSPKGSERRRLGKAKESVDDSLKRKMDELRSAEVKSKIADIEAFEEAMNIKKPENSQQEPEKAKEAEGGKESIINQQNQPDSYDARLDKVASTNVSEVNSAPETENASFNEAMYAKILGDLKRLDATKDFNSPEINKLYKIITKIEGIPEVEPKPYNKADFDYPIDYSKLNFINNIINNKNFFDINKY